MREPLQRWLTNVLTAAPSDWINSALMLAVVSMTVVVAVFYYLNRQLNRQYFSLWMLSWICFAGYLLAALGLQELPESRMLMMVRRACIGVSGLCMFWGTFQLTFQPRTLRELRAAVTLVLTYCFLATYFATETRWLTVLLFTLLGSAGMYTGRIYLKRRAVRHGSTVLGLGHLLWGGHLLLFPWLELSPTLMAGSYLVSAGLAVMIAIGMVVEQEVAVAEKNYRLLFDAASDAVFLVDMWNLTVLEANRAAERLTKYPVDALLGSPFERVCPSVQRGSGNVLEHQKAFKSVFRPYEEFYMSQAEGGRVVCEGEVVLAEWRQRMVFQINIRDVGEHRKLAEQIHRAEKLTALGQLVAGVAHELNNPLAIVMGKTQLLARHPRLDAALRNDVDSIFRQSERASRIVQDLLSYARPTEPHKAPLDLNRVVRDVLEWRRPAAEAAGVTLRARVAKQLPLTQADRIQIEQIVGNLVGNGVDALRDQPLPRVLQVTTEVTTNFLRVSVADNGPGIPRGLHAKIFEPFFTTKPIGRGTGLGLTICNTYIQEHRGKIWFETEEGKGTTFCFDLPLLDCGGAVAPEPERATDRAGMPRPAAAPAATPAVVAAQAAPVVVAASPAPQRGQRMLIVDDEPEIAMVLQATLEDSGYQVQTASNGREALRVLTNENFDVILSDIRMPDLDGRALYHQLRELKPALASRVIFVTGDTVSGPTREFLDDTGNLWLSKPFRLSDVISRVQQVLQGRPAAV